MSRPSSVRAPKDSGTCRPKRRRGEAPRGKEWVRPYKRAQRALDNGASLILAAIHAVVRAGCCASRPVQSTQILIAALRQVTVATEQYVEAKRNLAEADVAVGRIPPELQNGEAALLLELANERCQKVRDAIDVAASEVLLGQAEILNAVASGEVVPEDPSAERPRRRVIPIRRRPLFVRAFLASRQPRVADRITPILLRRRRTPRPAEIRVPRRNLRGRAPPLSSTCAL